MIGAMFQGYFSSRFGRRRTTVLAAGIMVVGAALISGAVYLGMFIVGRILTGISCGMLVTNTSVYINEIAPAHSRGLVTGIAGASVTMGVLTSSALGLGFTFVENTIQWRGIWIVTSGLAVILFLSVLLIPESPRWLVENQRYGEAWETLKKIHGLPTDPDSVMIPFLYWPALLMVIESRSSRTASDPRSS